MTTHEERQRLAAMGNALRPDWPARSLYTLLTNDPALANRSYNELVCAAADCWSDPDTKTPKRLGEPGPWWIKHIAKSAKTLNANAIRRCPDCGGYHSPACECDPPENERSHGRGAAKAKAALHETKEAQR